MCQQHSENDKDESLSGLCLLGTTMVTHNRDYEGVGMAYEIILPNSIFPDDDGAVYIS